MDTNLVITLGLLVAVLAVPAAFRRWADDQVPVLPFIALVIGGGAVVWAVLLHPGGFGLKDILSAVVEVVSRVL